jgi:hypothetical protein
MRWLWVSAVLLAAPCLSLAWQAGGVPVCTDPAGQTSPQIAKLSDGFAIVWTDVRNGNYDIFAQKLDFDGRPLWTINGNAVCDHDSVQQNPIVVDGSNGGALFFWEDNRIQYPPWPYMDIWGQRFNRDGEDVWVHNGRMYSSYSSSYKVAAIPDGSGGVLLVEDLSQPPDGSGLYGFHLDSLGTILWQGGIGEGTYLGTGAPMSISDGGGGAIVSWFENHPSLGSCLFAQRMTLAGQPLWDSVGVVMAQFSSPPNYGSHFIVPDATHGVIATWSDNRAGNWDIYAQRASGDSLVRWQTNGVPVRAAPGDQANPKAVSDGQGGAIIIWEDGTTGSRDIYAQRVDSSGARLWDTLGVPVIRSAGDQTKIQAVSDDAGGVIVTWQDNRNGNNDIYTQRLNPNGQRLWDTLGVQVCVWSGEQTAPEMCQDGSGGAVIAWQDARNGNNDIYAQRVSASGSGIWSEPSPSRLTPQASRLMAFPNPFISFATLPGHEAERFSLYDISGRRIGTYKGDRIGEGLSPGVYFLRCSNNKDKPLRIVKIR